MLNLHLEEIGNHLLVLFKCIFTCRLTQEEMGEISAPLRTGERFDCKQVHFVAKQQRNVFVDHSHPKLRGEGSSDKDEKDRMNEEFIEIARKAALDAEGGDGLLRNRMRNAHVKLSDTQQMFV